MPKVVHKYPFNPLEDDYIEMPQLAEILVVDMQFGNLFVWARVDPEAKMVKRRIIMRGTGADTSVAGNDSPKYINSTFRDSPFVWHFFDVGEDNEA